MSDDPDWEKAKDGCYYHAWYRHLGHDPDDKYTVHCEYKPKIDDTPPEALEKAADAVLMTDVCPICRAECSEQSLLGFDYGRPTYRCWKCGRQFLGQKYEALELAADAMGEWDQEKADKQAPCAPCSSCRCALCGYEYEPLGRWTLKWDGEQWICGRCERNTESKVTAPKRCTCGQAKSGAGGFHSDWCDLVTGG